MTQASAASSRRQRDMISTRCGEPASSSPSKKNLRLTVGFKPAARNASKAVRIAMTPALSSDEERA
jgi:hypothetical protein